MAKKKSKGLGDTIAKVTKATKIDKLVKWIAGEDCGCDQRQAKLNALFPYTTKQNCLVEEEDCLLASNTLLYISSILCCSSLLITCLSTDM